MAEPPKNSWIPSPACLCCQFEWQLTTSRHTMNGLILSDFFPIPGITQQAFRLCAETDADNKLIRLSCYTNSIELNSLGYRAGAVTFNQTEKNGHLHELKKVPTGSQQQTTSFHFRWNFSKKPLKLDSKKCLIVRVYFTGSVEQYALYRFDTTLVQELWNAAINKHMTDVIFQVSDSTLPAHKFILAARSPVFRAMFNTDMVESRTGRVQIVDVEDPDVFEQFLRFLYTGQLFKPATKQLGMVAEKYQVGTLTALCREAVASETDFHDSVLVVTSAYKMAHEDGETKCISHSVQGDKLEIRVEHTETFNVTNVAQTLNEIHRRWIRNKEFMVKLETSSDVSASVVTFYSNSVNGPAWRLSGVDLLVLTGGLVTNKYSMVPVTSEADIGKHSIQVFTLNVKKSFLQDPTAACHFIVHRSSTMEQFQYQLRDCQYAQELWASAINKERTDVEFQVGGKTFSAHKAVVSARCPTLAGLIPEESSPSSPATVQISPMDPVVFEELLYFLYTGLIRTAPPDEHLLEAAKFYKVKTLQGIGLASGRRQQVNQEQLSQTILLLC